jgi:hypothetical protein
MRKKLFLTGLAIVLPITALHAMAVAVFLEKAERLERRGAMAMFSSDLGALKTEVKAASESLRAERVAAERAGRRPAYCPSDGRATLTPREILDHFRAIPPAERARMPLRDGLRDLLARKYPCPA